MSVDTRYGLTIKLIKIRTCGWALSKPPARVMLAGPDLIAVRQVRSKAPAGKPSPNPTLGARKIHCKLHLSNKSSTHPPTNPLLLN